MLHLVICADAAPATTARWQQHGTPNGPEISLDAAALRGLDEVRINFQGLFATARRPFVSPETFEAWGAILYETFFRPATPALPSTPQSLLIRSADPSFLNLPWE